MWSSSSVTCQFSSHIHALNMTFDITLLLGHDLHELNDLRSKSLHFIHNLLESLHSNGVSTSSPMSEKVLIRFTLADFRVIPARTI